MLVGIFTCFLLWLDYGALALPPSPSLQVRTLPGRSVQDTYDLIRRGLTVASLGKRQERKEEISLARSWTDATLLHIEVEVETSQGPGDGTIGFNTGIEVTCTTCYVRGLATAQLTIDNDFDMEDTYNTTATSVQNNIEQLASNITSYLDNYTDSVMTNLTDGIDWSDFNLPTFPYEFDLAIPPMPACHLQFQFDGLEMYMAVETVLSAGATYELNLYSSTTFLGLAVDPVQFGLVLQVDLILAIDGEIDISSGIHIKLDDGVTMNIDLFGSSVNELVVNGGQFEFLPVTVQSGGVVISAALRVGLHCGVEVETLSSMESLAVQELRAGIEVAVFANIAEFVTNVTYAPEDSECDLEVVQEFNIAVGAVAGASMVLDLRGIEAQTWGPVPEISTAIYTTTLAEVCALKGTPPPTAAGSNAAGEKREDLTTTTISTTLTTTGVSCTITGIAACPASAQVSTKATTVKSLVTAVPSGVEATFPTPVYEIVQSTIPFGSRANRINPTSGQPTAYVAPTDASHDVLDGKIGGVNTKLIVGVSLGLGIPVLLAALGVFLFCQRHKKYTSVPPAASPMILEPYAHHGGFTDNVKRSKQADVAVREM